MRLRLEHGQRDDLKTLHPAYFALVMATGIVSIATDLHVIPVLPKVLFWLNALFLAWLAAATCARLLRYLPALAADIQNHSRAVGFFTTAAATAVFGTELVSQIDAARIAAASPLGRRSWNDARCGGSNQTRNYCSARGHMLCWRDGA